MEVTLTNYSLTYYSLYSLTHYALRPTHYALLLTPLQGRHQVPRRLHTDHYRLRHELQRPLPQRRGRHTRRLLLVSSSA